MFGVVVCPRCRTARGVELSKKTTTCACGFEIRVVPSRIRTRAETARELVPVVGRVNAELRGGLEAYERAKAPRRRRRSPDIHARVVAASASAGDRVHRIRAAAVELTRELEVFSPEDWRKVLDGLGISNPEQALEELLEDRTVFEPKPGFYRAVSLTP